MSVQRRHAIVQVVLLLRLSCIAQLTTTSENYAVNGISTNSNTNSTLLQFSSSISPGYEARENVTSWNDSVMTSTARLFTADDVEGVDTTTRRQANMRQNDTETNKNDTDSTKQRPPWTFEVAYGMFRVYPSVLLAIGSTGNILSIIVFLQPKMIKFPTYIYLTAIAIFDTIVLLTSTLTSIGEVHDRSIISNAFCKGNLYVHSASIHISVWLVVSVTVERAVAIGLPLKATCISTRRNALIVISIIVMIFAFLNMHMLWTMSKPEEGPPRCYPDLVQYGEFFKAWTWIDASLFSFIPCVLLFVLNIAVIVLMKRANRRMPTITANQRRSHGARTAQSTQITMMLLAVSFFFLVCVTPSAVLFIYRYTYWEYRFRDHPEEYNLNIFVQQVLTFLLLCNHSFNFLLYAASGKRFREEFSTIFCCWHKKSWFARLRESTRWRMSKQSTMTTTGSMHTRLSKAGSGTSDKPEVNVRETNFSPKSSNTGEAVTGISHNTNTYV